MQRGVLLILLSAVLILFGINFVAAATDVAYIYRHSGRVDNNILDVFDELGLSVDLIQEKNLPANLGDYGFIFLGDEKFREMIPIDKNPSVIVNYHRGDEWGLTDNDGVSQMGATIPLTVVVDESEIQVYTKAFIRGTLAVPYYYLEKDNKAASVVRIAATRTTSNGKNFGDVIGYIPEGGVLANGNIAQGNICYFGIAKSKYWTPEAKELFKECVDFVHVIDPACFSEIDCGEDTSSESFCKGKDVYRDVTDYSCANPGEEIAQCSVDEFEELAEVCEFGCENGACFDVECFDDLECPEDSFSAPFCMDGEGPENLNLLHEVTKYSCENPGTSRSECVFVINEVLIEDCSSTCSEGSCIEVECFSDLDCPEDLLSGPLCSESLEDSNVVQTLTEHTCENPGTAISECVSEESENLVEDCEFGCFEGSCFLVECFVDEDCGVDGMVGGEFCSEEDVAALFETFTCNNPGAMDSFCSSIENEEVVEACNDGCEDAVCLDIGCFSDLDCPEDGFTGVEFCAETESENVYQLFTDYTCVDAGTAESECVAIVDQVLVEDCSFGCEEAMCLLPSDIECFSDSDCPEDFSSDLFCAIGTGIEIDNVYSLLTDYRCMNPGTESSQCVFEEVQILEEVCSFGCVEAMCLLPPDQEGVHDVALIDFTNSTGGIRLELGTVDILEGEELQCNEKYKITVRIENKGDFVENVTFNGGVDSLPVDHNPKDNLAVGSKILKSKIIDFALAEGFYNITVEASIDGFVDNTLGDNIAMRQVFVSCSE